MINITFSVKTNLSDTYLSDKDDREFCSWFSDRLYKSYGQFFYEVETPELEGIAGVRISIDEIFDYSHDMVLSIDVDTELSEDEIAEYDALFDYLNAEVVPQFIDGFNSVCTTAVPMNPREKFDGMKFDGDAFYVECYQYGDDDYKVERITTVIFQLTPDYDISF